MIINFPELGRSYDTADFAGRGYVTLFFNVVSDVVEESTLNIATMEALLSSAESSNGVTPGGEGEVLMVSGGVWVSSTIATTPDASAAYNWTGAHTFTVAPVLAAAAVVANGGLNNSPALVFRARYDSDAGAGVTSADYDISQFAVPTAGGGAPLANLRWTNHAGATMAELSSGGQLHLNAGTAPLPSLTFGETTTGFYRYGSTVIGVAISGVAKFFISNFSITPVVDDTCTLGNASQRFNYIYGVSAAFSTRIGVGGVVDAGYALKVTGGTYLAGDARSHSVIPMGDNVYACGNSGNRWASVWCISSAMSTSARKFKENIEPLSHTMALDAVRNLPIYSYSRIGADFVGRRFFGPILDEVPEWMRPYADDDENWDSDNLFSVAVLAVQAVDSEVAALKRRVAELESRSN